MKIENKCFIDFGGRVVFV